MAGRGLIWLSALLGGTMFGFGMVLASGCGSKNLVRLGGGNLKSLVVLIVLGIGAFATLKGITAVARVASVERAAIEMPHGQDLPALLARATRHRCAPSRVVARRGHQHRTRGVGAAPTEGRRGEAWLGGAGVGAVIVALWWISGCLGHLAEDPNTLQETFVRHQLASHGSAQHGRACRLCARLAALFQRREHRLTMGIVCVVGVVLGSAAVAVASGKFRWEGLCQCRGQRPTTSSVG